MEHRIIIFTDDSKHETGRKKHDCSLICSLPRIDDIIYDKIMLNFQEKESIIQAKVWAVEFDYDLSIVRIYAKVLRYS